MTPVSMFGGLSDPTWLGSLTNTPGSLGLYLDVYLCLCTHSLFWLPMAITLIYHHPSSLISEVGWYSHGQVSGLLGAAA